MKRRIQRNWLKNYAKERWMYASITERNHNLNKRITNHDELEWKEEKELKIIIMHDSIVEPNDRAHMYMHVCWKTIDAPSVMPCDCISKCVDSNIHPFQFDQPVLIAAVLILVMEKSAQDANWNELNIRLLMPNQLHVQWINQSYVRLCIRRILMQNPFCALCSSEFLIQSPDTDTSRREWEKRSKKWLIFNGSPIVKHNKTILFQCKDNNN